MSATLIAYLRCDLNASADCWTAGESEEADPGVTVGELRALLRRRGWSYSGGKDRCPDCRTYLRIVRRRGTR